MVPLRKAPLLPCYSAFSGPFGPASPVAVDHVTVPLTSALLVQVTPVPILTLGACATPKSSLAGALSHNLREESVDQ